MSQSPQRRWYHLIGPGLITACVVIGPGSILTSSKVGAANGFALTWVVAVAVIFMLAYMQLGAKLGVTASESPGTLITNRAGRWLAALIGVGVFFISAAFQFGNNLGVHSAVKPYVDSDALTISPFFVVGFNALAIGFLYLFKNLYKAVERLMMVFVGLMLASFALNLTFALVNMPEAYDNFEKTKRSPFTAVQWKEDKPTVEYDGKRYEPVTINRVPVSEIVAHAKKKYPKQWQDRFARDLHNILTEMKRPPRKTVPLELKPADDGETVSVASAKMTHENWVTIDKGNDPLLDISLLGLFGTTFVITAAFYQVYLVQQKGWGREELANGLVDARVGAILMALITLMIMSTAGAVLRGEYLNNVDDVARQLAPLFGNVGRPIFCVGLFSAAYSSFLVNSMIGGFILADGLGLGSKPDDKYPKLFTTLVLLTGMSVALIVINLNWNPVPAIVAAQAVTVVASPLVAGALWWLTNRKDVMGEDRNRIGINIVAGIGFVLLLAMAWYTAMYKVGPQLSKMLA